MRELEDVRAMIVAWKESYYKIALEGGEGEFVVEAACQDLYEDIREFALPYLSSLLRWGKISEDEYNEFMVFCREQIEELEQMLKEAFIGG